MAHMRFLIAAMASTSASIAFQIGLATGHFKSYEWAMYPLFAFSGALWIAWLILTFYYRPKEEKQPSPESAKIHQENKQTIDFRPQQNLYIGGAHPDVEQEKLRLEEQAIQHMKSAHPTSGYTTKEIAQALNVKPHEARDILERLFAKHRTFSVNFDAEDGKAWLLEYLER